MKEKNYDFSILNINSPQTQKRIENKIKNNLFGIFYFLLKEDQPSMISSVISIIITLIQFLRYSFHEEIKQYWNYDLIINGISFVLSKITIIEYMKNTSEKIYTVIFYVAIFWLVLMIINIAYVTYSYTRSMFSVTWPLTTLKYFIRSIMCFIYIPFLELYFTILNCRINSVTGKSMNFYVTQYECWTGTQVIHSIVGIIAILILIIFALIIGYIYYEIKNDENNTLAR